jgi:hypothetical protein
MGEWTRHAGLAQANAAVYSSGAAASFNHYDRKNVYGERSPTYYN